MTVQHISALKAATEWYIQLTSGEATERDLSAWQEWKNADIANALAWQKVEEVTKPFGTINADIGLAALDNDSKNANKPSSKLSSVNRRQALKQLSLLLAIGTASWFTYREKPWQELLADYSTSVGETKKIALEDGSQLILNTESTIAVDFSAEKRVITLYKGEILIETGHENLAIHRPFIVATTDGAVTALGTRFSARKYAAFTRVNLYEGALRISPKQADSQHSILLSAGESIQFSEQSTFEKKPLSAGSDAWSNGFLVVDKVTLSDFLSELSRYKSGILRCDPSIAHLQISGAFPISDIDAVLTSIAKTLPIRIEKYTQFWVTIKPA